eukprot:gene4103-20285_t
MENWRDCSNQYYENMLKNAEQFLEKRRLKTHQELCRCREETETEFKLRLKEIAFQSLLNLRARFYESKKEMKLKVNRIEGLMNQRESKGIVDSIKKVAQGLESDNSNPGDNCFELSKDDEKRFIHVSSTLSIGKERNVPNEISLLEKVHQGKTSFSHQDIEGDSKSIDVEKLEMDNSNVFSEKSSEASVLDSKFLMRSLNDIDIKERLNGEPSEERFSFSSSLSFENEANEWKNTVESGRGTDSFIRGRTDEEMPQWEIENVWLSGEEEIHIKTEESGKREIENSNTIGHVELEGERDGITLMKKSSEIKSDTRIHPSLDIHVEQSSGKLRLPPETLENTCEISVSFCTEIEENCEKVIKMLHEEKYSINNNENKSLQQSENICSDQCVKGKVKVSGVKKREEGNNFWEKAMGGSKSTEIENGSSSSLDSVFGETQRESETSFENVFPIGSSPRSPSKYGRFKSERKERKALLVDGKETNYAPEPPQMLKLPNQPILSPSDSETEDIWLVTPLPSPWVQFSPLFVNDGTDPYTVEQQKQYFVFSKRNQTEQKNLDDISTTREEDISSENSSNLLSSKIYEPRKKTEVRKSKIPVRVDKSKFINFAVS